MKIRVAIVACVAAVAAVSTVARAADVPEMGWAPPTAENRLWTRWWWMGNAVDSENITKQLEMFHTAGLGGVEICPIYGVYGAESRYVDFLSPKWMNLLAHTYRETKRLAMEVDMTTGTGWPFGGKNVDVETASSGLVMKWFDTMPGETDLPKGKVISIRAYVPGSATGAEAAAGKQWPAGTRWLAAVQTGPMQKVKRSAPGGEGNVVDPYSVKAIDQYLGDFDKAFEGFQDDIPRGQFHDSFEYYGASWTNDFAEEFKKRRGYDILPHLAELNGDAPGADADTMARIKHDYRETLSDLHQDYMDRWTAWSHTHGSISRNQAHGGPGNILDVYAHTDIPECEIFHLYEEAHLPMLKLSSSAAHVTGKKLASSESYTWLGEHFSVALSEVKPACDFLFLAGVNHEFLHGIPYSPEDAAWPGWNFYASVNFGPYGGLWHDFPAFAAYVARCQSILQANKPSADVLLYVPFHQFWTEADPKNLMTQFTTPGTWMKPFAYYDTAMELWNKGYAYDEVSDQLLQNMKVNDNGRIETGGNTYRVIVVPKTPSLPLETMQQLVKLAKAGAKVAFIEGVPSDVPGFGDLENRRKALKAATEGMVWETDAPGISSAAVGKGVFASGKLDADMHRLAVQPEPMMADGVRFVRRQRADGFDYFVVNRSDKSVDHVVLGNAAKSAIIMDPRFDDRMGVANVIHGKTPDRVQLTMNPGDAYFIRTFDDKLAEGKAWNYFEPAGAPQALAGTWNVTFTEGGPALPKAFSTDKLGSWTLQSDPETKRFAGTAKYTLEFAQAPGGGGGNGADASNQIVDYRLDLGKVGDSARVTLNGKALGTLWCAPFSVDLGSALRAGKNTLEIEVTNVAANRIRDMDQRGVQWKIFRDINIVNTAYTPFDASNQPIRDSGLIGPVQLIPLKKAALLAQ